MTNIKIKACTVRVETPTGHPQGTGFILTPTLAVTCAHVVDACGVGLGGCVRLSFQAGGEPIEAEVLANGYHQDADVAFLRLLSPFPSAWLRAGPSAVTPAILGPSANTDGHTFRALGYPVVGDFQGMWAEGKILGSTTDGRGRRVLQLESQNIAPGMSGAPVLDMADNKHPSTGRVVGMVSLTYNADGTLKFRDAAFAVPSEILCDLCPEEIELQQPEKTAGDHIGQVAVKAEGDAVVATHGGTAARYVAVGGDVGGNITVMVQGEDVRAQELAYLDALLKKYDYWLDHYTPLAGIAEVRAAVQDGPRLDLPMPFIPPGFEKLTEHGFGERAEVRREPVDDLRAAVAEHRRIVLLGSPGSGKTTTLWRLAYDYALEAKADAHAPLPLLVPLGGYTGDGPFDVTLARHLGPLAPHLDIYRASGRLILLLDGLNEMPQADYAGRVGRVRDALEQHPDDSVVVTCRALDYVEKMEQLQKVEVSPLDETRIRDFVRNYLGETAGERLFWGMAGGDEVHDLWNTWRRAGETWEAFWTAKEIPEGLGWLPWKARYKLWMSLRKEPPQLLSLGRNPYLLLMMAQVYAGAGGELPANRAKLFAAFVDTLLGREKKRHSQDWIEVECQKEALAALAYAMQDERGRGTTVEHGWAAAHLDQVALDCDVERLLYLASSATLLDASDSTVRFYHQLLQEYFAAREMGRRVAAGEPLERYWPPERWWEPSGWEETVILLAGMKPDASTLLQKLASVNPVLAARCLAEGGAQAGEETRHTITTTLVARMTNAQQPPVARAQAGDALARLGDLRPGVGVDPATGLPDIVWCQVPAGPFLMGSTDDDELAFDWEKPQHLNETITQGYCISRYPLTNAQYAVFVAAGGYRKRHYWTEAGWEQKEQSGWSGPDDYGDTYNLSNHPVVGVSWYEAAAFCRWFTEQLQQNGHLKAGEKITLPTEPQWEKAARGVDGRRYPWGNDPDPNRANYDETGIGTTSAVGCFPGGVSFCGVEDLSGNVWEWCQTKWEDDYGDYQNDNDLEGGHSRVLRGGSFASYNRYVRCAFRSSPSPRDRDRSAGFRLVVVSPLPPNSGDSGL